MSEDMNKDQIEFDKSKLHKEYPAGSFVVTEEEVSMYCNSIGEKSDICHDKQKAIAAGYRDIVAPPTFCALFVRGFDRPDINLKFGNSGFHAGEAIDVLEPICVGDKLEASIQLSDVYVKTGRSGQMVFVVWEHIFRNQHGDISAKVRESHVRRE
jgi:hypothetical protein